MRLAEVDGEAVDLVGCWGTRVSPLPQTVDLTQAILGDALEPALPRHPFNLQIREGLRSKSPTNTEAPGELEEQE